MSSNVPHVNHYRKRLVAQPNEKACAVCYRPTDVVLMSTDSKDWFYCCAQHLKDPGLATPFVDQAAEAVRLKQIEINRVKAEYEENKRRKADAKEAADAAEKSKNEKDGKAKGSALGWIPNPFSGASNKDGDDKQKVEQVVTPTPEPKDFVLHRTMYQHRVNLKLQAAQQKARDAQWATLQFPSVPGK